MENENTYFLVKVVIPAQAGIQDQKKLLRANSCPLLQKVKRQESNESNMFIAKCEKQDQVFVVSGAGRVSTANEPYLDS